MRCIVFCHHRVPSGCRRKRYGFTVRAFDEAKLLIPHDIPVHTYRGNSCDIVTDYGDAHTVRCAPALAFVYATAFASARTPAYATNVVVATALAQRSSNKSSS